MDAQQADGGGANRSFGRIVIRSYVGVIVMIAILLALAGRIDYWQGWAFGLLSLCRMTVGVMLFRDNLELVFERTRPGPGTKGWDKVFHAIYTPANLALLIIAALDAGRFHWSSAPALPTFGLGLVVQVAGHALVLWSMRVNNFFSSTVRIQTDRGQRVVQDGPYRIVRHPGYVAAMLLAVGIALTLGSTWALIPAGVICVALVVRTHLEDTTLQRELEGYTEYIHTVRHRLLPGIW